MKGLQLILIASVGAILVSSVPLEQEKRLIKTSAEGDGEWLTEDQLWQLIRNRRNFIDITDHQDMQRIKPEDMNTSGNSNI